MNGVIYARYSSHSQSEQSIEGQIEGCMEYAKSKGIKIIDTYIDRALSARTSKRPAFLKMIADSEKRHFEVVIVYTLDRFSRDRYDSAVYKRELRNNGVKVISAKEVISEGAEGILVEGLLESIAQYYSAELARKVIRGQRLSAEKCKSIGLLPLGYERGKDGKAVVDPTKAAIIRQIFKLYAEGARINDIVEMLHVKGLRSARGNKIAMSGVYKILQNERYTGVYIYDDIRVEGGIPAIVEKDVFEEVQKRMSLYKHKPGYGKGNYLLSDRLYCGMCGSMMIGDSGRSRSGEIYNYYTCSKRKRIKNGENRCTKKPVQRQSLEDYIIDKTVNYVLKDDVIDYIAEKFMEIRSKEKSAGRLDQLKKDLAACEKEISNIVDAIAQGINISLIKQKVTDLELRKADIEDEIEKENRKDTIKSKEQLVKLLRSLKKGDIKNEQYRKLLVKTFVNFICIYDDKIVITYNYERPDSVLTCSDLEKIVGCSGVEPLTSTMSTLRSNQLS